MKNFKDQQIIKVITGVRRCGKSTYYQVALTTSGEDEGDNKILNRELAPLKKINDNYPKYILTLDDDLDSDFDVFHKQHNYLHIYLK